MLEAEGVSYTYREYTKDPLSAAELREVLGKLGLSAHDVLRTRDANQLGLDVAAMSEDALIAAMAEHPTLLQRPIAVLGERAVLGRPHEAILQLVQ